MIFVTGPHCAGKTHLARFLKRVGFQYIDLGPTIRSIWMTTAPDVTFEQFIVRGEEKFGLQFVDSLLVAELINKLGHISKEGVSKDLLVLGNRSVTGIDYIRSHMTLKRGRSTIFYIDAEKEVLYERYRRREDAEISKKDFEAVLDKDTDMGLMGIKEVADYIIHNSGTQKEFEELIQELIQSIYPNEVFYINPTNKERKL